MRGGGIWRPGGVASLASSLSTCSSSSGALGSAALASALYCFQSCSTWRSVSGVRFSSFAASVSKQ